MPNMFDPQLGVPDQPNFSLWATPRTDLLDHRRARSQMAPPMTAGPVSAGGGEAPPDAGAAGGPPTVTSNGIDGQSITAPAPQAAQLPTQGPGAMPARGAQPLSRAGRLRESLLGLVAGDAPQGYDGLLTPDEIKGARPSLLQSLFPAEGEPNAASRWTRNLDALVSHKQLGVAVARAGQLQQDRAKVEKQLGTAPEDAEGFAKWARRAYSMYSSIGDIDNVTKLNVIMQQIVANDHSKANSTDLFKGPNGELHYFNKDEKTQIPTGWEKVATTDGGAKVLMRAPANAPKGTPKFVDVAPNEVAQYATKGFEPEVTARTEIHAAETADVAKLRRSDQAVKEFRLNLAPYAKAAPVLQQSIVTLEDAMHNPDINTRKALYSSAIANFVQAADPKAQIRWQLLNYFKENINASAEDRVKLLLTRLKDGTLPMSTMEGMANHLKTLKGTMQAEIDAQRKAAVREHPGLDLDKTLREASTYFPEGGETSTPSDASDGTNLNDVDGYLKTLRSKRP